MSNSIFSASQRLDALNIKHLPKVSIHEYKEYEKWKFHFLYYNDSDEPITCVLELKDQLMDLQGLRDWLRNAYDRAHDSIFQKRRENQQVSVDQEYKEFIQIGRKLRKQLTSVRNDGEENRLWQYLFSTSEENPGYIVVSSDRFLIPYELLCYPDNEKRILKSLLGAKYRFIRKCREGKKIDNETTEQSIPRIGTIFNLALDGVIQTEKAFFNRLNEEGSISFKDYTEPPSFDVNHILAKMESESHDILHLDCHINIGQSVEELYMDFNQFRINYLDFDCFKKHVDGKAVFINGCNSQMPKVNETINLTREFLRLEASSVISVDIDVPDIIATEASIKFYDILTKPDTTNRFDEIIHQVALQILNEHNDIGGFFYSVYGNTQLKSYN